MSIDVDETVSEVIFGLFTDRADASGIFLSEQFLLFFVFLSTSYHSVGLRTLIECVRQCEDNLQPSHGVVLILDARVGDIAPSTVH